MSKIKTMLAFVALMLCGGAWAATTPTADENGIIPLYWWTFDGGNSSTFNDGQKGQNEANWTDTSNNFEITEKGYAIYGCAPFLNQTLTENAWTGASFSLVGSFKVNLEDKDSSNNQSNALLFGHGWTSDAFALAADASKVYIVWNRSHFSYTDSAAKGSIASEALSEMIGDLTTGYHSYALVYDFSATTLYAYVDGVEVIKKDGVTLGSFENESNKKRAGVLSLPGGGEGDNIGSYRTKSRCDDYRIYATVLTPNELKNIAAETIPPAEMPYCFHLDKHGVTGNNVNTVNVGSAGTKGVTVLTTVQDKGKDPGTKTVTNGTIGKGVIGDEGAIIISDSNGISTYEDGWTLSFWLNLKVEGSSWVNAGFFMIGDTIYRIQKTDASPKAVQFYACKMTNGDYKSWTAINNTSLSSAIVCGEDWTHVAIVAKPSSDALDIYVNGTKTISNTKIGTTNIWGDSNIHTLTGFIIGTPSDMTTSRGKSWNMMDEVAIFTKALGSTGIAYLANNIPTRDAIQYVAKISDRKYVTLAEAVAATQPGDEIEIIENSDEAVSLDRNVVFNVSDGKSFVLSGNMTGDYNVTKKGLGTLSIKHDVAAANVLDVAEGTLKYQPVNSNGFKGTLNVHHGATYVNMLSADVWAWNYNGVKLNIHGTFDMGSTRANVNSGQTWNVYGGATITCASDNTRCFDFADQSNPTFNFLPHEEGDSDVVTFDVQGSYRTKDPTFDIHDGVTVVITKTQDLWGGSHTLTKSGNGTLKFATSGKMNNANVALNVTAGHLDLTELTDSAAENIKGNLTLANGVILHLPENLAENTEYTLCAGTLTASLMTAPIYLGNTEKTARLSFNTENKTLSYAIVVAATFGGDNYSLLADALSAAGAVATAQNPQTVTLLATAQDIDIPENVIVDPGEFGLTGTLKGEGVYLLGNSTTAPNGVTADEWRGTIWLKNLTWSQFAFETLGNENSTIRMTGVSGYAPNSNNNTKGFAGTVELVDEGDTKAFTFANCYASTYSFGKLTGSGTLTSSGNYGGPARYAFKDASLFTGTIAMSATGYSTTLGNVTSASDYVGSSSTGMLKIMSGATATISSGKSFGARDGMFVYGTLAGSGNIDANITLYDGATIDVTGNTDGAALTLTKDKTLTFGGVLNLVGVADGQVILKNVSTMVDFNFATVKIDGVAVGRLVYDETEKTISYSATADDSWTPDMTTAEDGIFTWSVGSLWKQGAVSKTWTNDNSVNVKFDAATVSGVVIEGQITAGNVVVLCSDDQDHAFEFHNPTKTVDGEIEVDETNKLTANSVLMPLHRGNLGLKVPIVGEIGFSDNTHLVFRTGTGSKISEAYTYNVNTHGAAIVVDVTDGAGKFEVPTSMYAQKFEVKENATIVFNKTTDIAGVYSGAGKLAKMGEGTTTITSVNFPSVGIEVIEGTLKLQKSSNYPFWDGTALPVKVFGGATLDINGYEGFKSAITLEAGATLASNDADRNLTYDNASIASVSLNGDATVHAAGNFGILRNGRGETSFALNGHKLTKTGNGSFFLCNTAVAEDSTGSIDVQAGRLAIWNKAVNVPKVDIAFANGTSLALSANLSARDVTITGAMTITSDSTGTLSGSSIKLTTAASTLTVPTKLADDAVTTDIEGKFVDFNETDKTYSVADKIAKIGDKNYSSVGAAITAATDGQTVEIVANSTETIALTKDVTISVADGQSFSLTKLTGSYNVTKVGAGTLTVNCGVASGKTLNVNEGTLTLKCDGEAIVGTVNIAADATLDMSTSGYGDRINYRAGNSPIINVKGTWLLGENRQTINNTVTLNVYAGATISGAGDNNDTYACALDFLNTNTIHFYKNSDDEENAEATFATVITPRHGGNNSVTFSIPEGMTVNWTGAKRSDEQSANCNKKGDGKIIVSGGGALKISAPMTRPVVFGEAILDLSGFTTSSASVFAGGLTIGEDTTIKFPEGFAEDAEFTLTNGSLTSEAGATVSDKVILVGATEKTVTLTFGEHTVAYSLTDPNDTWTYNKASGNWSDAGAWTDPTGGTHSWSEATARTIAVFNASQTSAILVDGIYAPKMVQLIGTGDEFIFHNGTGGVDGTVELDAEQYCINAPVLTTGFTCNLGLRVAITRTISFGSTTKLIFSSGDVGDVTTAYAYTIDGRTNPIGVSGSGKFIVPSSMYGIAFDVESKATAVYQEVSATITGAITGTGTVEFKNGVTKDLGAAVKDQTLHYVSSGKTPNTLAWTGDGSTSFTSTDSKTKPVVKVESEATLKLNAHDCSGWNGGLTEHGWFVNNGTLVFSKPTGTRFWRDHVVFGPGSTMQIDTGDHHIYMYGGVGTADNCQLTLASGTATIEKGAVNTEKSNHALYIGFTSATGYASNTDANKGVGINVGEGATLTVSVPLMGGDPMAKYGAGTLVLEDNSAYTGSIALYGGSIKAASHIDLNRFTSKDPHRPAVSETQEGEMYVYALSYGKIKVDACGYVDVAEAMKHLTTSSTIEIIDTTITKESLESAYGIMLTLGEDNTFTVSVAEAKMESADEVNLMISEICPKVSVWDENHCDAGWLEVVNTSGTKWVNFANYSLARFNRGKEVKKLTDWKNSVSALIPPGGRLVIKTSEDYAHADDKTITRYSELGNVIVLAAKVNPKKYPLVVLTKGKTTIQSCVVPVDVPENKSVCYDGELKNGATVSYITTATKGTANDFTNAVAVGPQVTSLYGVADAPDPWIAFPQAQLSTDYSVTLPVNPVYGVEENEANSISKVQLIYQIGFADPVTNDTEMVKSETKDALKGWLYTGTIPASALTTAGQVVKFAVKITDGANNEWRSPSFNNGDDGFEWYGTIIAPTTEQTDGGLNTWHIFADESVADGCGSSNAKPNAWMNKDADEGGYIDNEHPFGARVGIYDSETGMYYDNVRIDKRGHTSGNFTKKAHGLKFSKSQPYTGTDAFTGQKITCRKSSLTAEYGDPTFIRQALSFALQNRNGAPAPFCYPLRLNMNGQFYQLAFHSERFTDELIEDIYGLDPKGYSYKNIGTFANVSSAQHGSQNSIPRKTPDDGRDEFDDGGILRTFCDSMSAADSITEATNFDAKPTYSSALSKIVAEKFDLPAWLNYLAISKVTLETDDVWANLSGYYDINGTGTWMPLAYDMNQSLGQWHYGDDRRNPRPGLIADEDAFKCHPFYGGFHIRMHKTTANNSVGGNANRAVEAIFQNEKYRRLFLRRFRTIMDKELGSATADSEATETSEMFKLAKEMVKKISTVAAKDRQLWTNYGTSCDTIWVWPTDADFDTPEKGLTDLWENYIVPRRTYLYVKHLASNATEEFPVGYGLTKSAGIPAAQSSIETLKGKFAVEWDDAHQAVVLKNKNMEAVDVSGWAVAGRLAFVFPEGTVIDQGTEANPGTLYITANRTRTVELFGNDLSDQIIIGNAAANDGVEAIVVRTDTGLRILGDATDQETWIRFESIYGNTNVDADGDEGEWFTLKNVGEASVNLEGMTICILKDDAKSTEADGHCHITFDSKSKVGSLAAGASKTFNKADWASKGWSKIQNNKLIIKLYDKYGINYQTLKVTQKDYPMAYGKGAFLEYSEDKWKQVWNGGDVTVKGDYLNKDLYVRAAEDMTLTLDNPTYKSSSTLKISGEGTVTITGTLDVSGVKTAIKSSGDLVFADGSYTITASDDCIQADGDITINGGTFICHSTGNDGIDSNQNIVINGGTIFAFTAATETDGNKSTGLDVNEGHTITINGGTIIATSATSAALKAMTVNGKHQIVEVSEVSGATKAIGDVIVTFPTMDGIAAVLVSTPNLTEEEVTPEGVTEGIEIKPAEGEGESQKPAIHVVIPQSWVKADDTVATKKAAEAYVLGLAAPTAGAVVSAKETGAVNTLKIVDNVLPRVGTGVTVERKLKIGTTVGELSEDTSVTYSDGFEIQLPTGGDKVKYIKIEYIFK